MENKFKGLSSQLAAERLLYFGLNEIEKSNKISLFRILLNQLRSPLIYILIFAGLITFFLKDYPDTVIIFMAVLVNTALGFFQEFKAEKSLLTLQQFIVPYAWVLRDGQERYLPANQLVPGDVVILKTGEKVPADGVVIEAAHLYLNEAILTGESETVEKKPITFNFNPSNFEAIDPINRLAMGTLVASGRGKMLVIKTGKQTQIGKIAITLQQTSAEQTPLRLQISQLAGFLAWIIVAFSFLIFLSGLIQGKEWVEMFTLSVAVAVAGIPEGLVIAVTTILVLGMQRLLASQVLVRKLLAAETLGSVTCICADKTGTLTEGKMKVIDFKSSNFPLLIKASLLCNNLINPLEMAIFAWAEKELGKNKDFKKEEILSQKRLAEIPFASDHKYTAVLYADFLYISGAPEKILNFCHLGEEEKIHWQQQIDKYSNFGYRVLALAYKPNHGLTSLKSEIIDKLSFNWLGLLILEDPIRKDVVSALKECQKAGIKIKVVTGDYLLTAKAVLNQLQLVEGGLKDEQIMDGEELGRIPLEEFIKKIDKIFLFCRVSPAQKIKIVKALQARNETVAMIGDGVNDALALKKADIGVVVAEASAVAKETADMVLLDSNFNSVLRAVKIGREIFQNIKKVVLYLLTYSFTEIFLIGTALVFDLPVPLLAGQILWINLIEDGLPAIALAFEKEKGSLLLKELPRAKGAPILDFQLKSMLLIGGIIANIGLFGLFWWLYQKNLPLDIVRTIIFLTLGLDSLFYVFVCKSLKKNLWEIKIFDNLFLNLAILIGFFLLYLTVYFEPLRSLLRTTFLPLWLFFLVLFFAIFKVGLIELVKIFYKEK